MFELFEEYEYTEVTNLADELPDLIGLLEYNGTLYGFDGGYFDGVRGIDHNSILSGLRFNTWDDLHNTVKFIRLVPESGVALISGLQVSDDTLEQVEEYGYTIENY